MLVGGLFAMVVDPDGCPYPEIVLVPWPDAGEVVTCETSDVACAGAELLDSGAVVNTMTTVSPEPCDADGRPVVGA